MHEYIANITEYSKNTGKQGIWFKLMNCISNICIAKNMGIILIIIYYFENVVFFHVKLGSDVRPRVENQTSGDTLQDSTQPLSGKITISQLSIQVE